MPNNLIDLMRQGSQRLVRKYVPGIDAAHKGTDLLEAVAAGRPVNSEMRELSQTLQNLQRQIGTTDRAIQPAAQWIGDKTQEFGVKAQGAWNDTSDWLGRLIQYVQGKMR